MQVVDEIARLAASVRHRRTTGVDGARWQTGLLGVWQLKKRLAKCLQKVRYHATNGRLSQHLDHSAAQGPSHGP